jgi:aldehyde dehydrogenase (NAD+)
MLVKHKDIDKVAFTGSTAIGKRILSLSPSANLKRVTLELGGKSPNIICHDADLDKAADVAIAAAYANNGQSCNAGSRTFVHKDIYDVFVEKVVERAKKIKVGDPFDKDSVHGTIIDEIQFKRVLSYIELGQKEGARLLFGGKRLGTKGYYIEPAVFADVTDDMRFGREEIFGPVLSVFKFSDYDEVVRRANDTEYGLAAAVQTQSIQLYTAIAKRIRAGQIYINGYDYIDATTPFGGFKASGMGRELGKEGLKAYLETKTILINTQQDILKQ